MNADALQARSRAVTKAVYDSGLGKRTRTHRARTREKVGGLAAAQTAQTGALQDLESALKNLGYKAKDVDQLIQGRPEGGIYEL